MKRRTFLGLAGSTALLPLAARAQGGRVRRISYLSYGSGDASELDGIAAFEQRLKAIGWVIGDTLRIAYRFPSGNVDRMRDYATELVGLNPDVIVCVGTPETMALRDATRTIPIVFWANTDPVGSGIVPNLAHPGGNVTGLQGFEYSLAGKWVDLLRQMAPRITRVGFLYNRTTIPFYQHYLDVGAAVAASFGLAFVDLPVTDPVMINSAAASLVNGGGLVAPPDSFTSANVDALVRSTTTHSVPAIFAFSFFPDAGALMSYGYNPTKLAENAAEYADQILRGAKPGDLSVQAPTAFELAINLKTAAALGLMVPPALLLSATEVIQ